MDNFSDIVEKARKFFQVNGDFTDLTVQKFSHEWEEFIDCESFDDIASGDKLKIIKLAKITDQTKKSDVDNDQLLVSD